MSSLVGFARASELPSTSNGPISTSRSHSPFLFFRMTELGSLDSGLGNFVGSRMTQSAKMTSRPVSSLTTLPLASRCFTSRRVALAGQFDDALIDTRIGQNAKHQRPGRADFVFNQFDFRRFGLRNDDFDAVGSHAADGHFFLSARVHALGDGRNHPIHIDRAGFLHAVNQYLLAFANGARFHGKVRVRQPQAGNFLFHLSGLSRIGAGKYYFDAAFGGVHRGFDAGRAEIFAQLFYDTI